MSIFKIGQLVVLDNKMRARVLGFVGRHVRIMRLDGVEQILPPGDVALLNEDAEIEARERNLAWEPVGPTTYSDGHGGYLRVPAPDSDDADYFT